MNTKKQELDHVSIRSYESKDHAEVLYLYSHGLLHGQIDPSDNIKDLHNINKIYLDRHENHFWIAEAKGRIVGTIGIIGDKRDVARIRRLRVDPAWQQTPEVSCLLIKTAVDHTRNNGYLKLVLDTHCHSQRALSLLTQLGFQHNRTKKNHDTFLMEFYINLYLNPDHENNHEATDQAIPQVMIRKFIKHGII